ncbi:p53-like transcription factor [Amniculicola lignicola CBS 123094]|uniref:p53-like transcription factor n=1 Tax=Amniculicola lignicola CBS 123094 TaxID=1392246 RepID=A0A6A5WIL9_9PLEO|nr:p53-like transcription factor [Amniculicola lignicola CBS 123094]
MIKSRSLGTTQQFDIVTQFSGGGCLVRSETEGQSGRERYRPLIKGAGQASATPETRRRSFNGFLLREAFPKRGSQGPLRSLQSPASASRAQRRQHKQQNRPFPRPGLAVDETMEGFDTITMSYLAPPMSLQNVTASDQQLSVPMMPMDSRSNYDAETFAGDDTYGQHSLQPPPLKRFSSAYEDPFSDVLSGYEQSVHPDQNGAPESPSIDRDNKLLSFSLPSVPYALLDYALRRVPISMSAQLHGMFFLAESPWATAGDVAPPPNELTCYRRNLFQITGTITLPRSLQYVLSEQGDQIPILGHELTISATESLEGNAVKIISVPWKTPASSTAAVEDKTEKEPPSNPLDLSTGQDMDSEYVSFPISWKRLQFRIATANNGRRKELQQHFVVRLKLMATLHTGAKVPICEVRSGAIIVRGRSPRNFQSRKDMPISSGGSTARKAAHLPQQPTRTSTGDTTHANHNNVQANTPTPKPLDGFQLPFDFNPNDLPVSPDFLDWKMPSGAMTAIPPDPPSAQMHPLTPYAQSTPEISRNPLPPQPARAPVSLSLTDDEPKKSASPAEPMRKRATPARPPSFSLGLIGSPDESADLLYEYFPLGLDDWMPPVDAVYRPHVVHHTNMPQDPKALAVKNKSKRYFSDAW